MKIGGPADSGFTCGHGLEAIGDSATEHVRYWGK